MRFDKKKLQNIEYILPLIMLALFLIGIVAITIATANPFTGEELTFSEIMANLDFSVVGLQGAFFAVGLVVMVLIMLVNYRLYAKIWYAVLAARRCASAAGGFFRQDARRHAGLDIS